MQLDTIAHMNALDYLRTLLDNSVHCCVASPPYYNLRDYSADGQIGLEDTPAAFVANLVEVFEEVRRVLRDDGVCWVNLGDTYAGGGRGSSDAHRQRIGENTANSQALGRMEVPSGLKSKDLIGIPWRVAFALQDAGWWLRSDIIWHKPNPMPESVTDRPTKAHEYVFLLTKSAKYWYDADAIREGAQDNARRFNGGHDVGEDRNDNGRGDSEKITTRNKRTVWTVPTEPSSLKHFAMFPQALIEPMILAGCPATVCSECGAGYVRKVKVSGGTIGKSWVSHDYDLERGKHDSVPGLDSQRDNTVTKYTRQTLGFSPSCTCNADQDAGIVIDPFMGTGTTALVAQKHGRHWLGCDVNAETVELANERTRYHGDDKRMLKEQSAGVQQLDMFGNTV